MNNTMQRWLTVPFLILYSLWAVFFYQLAFTAWTLEYSYIGVVLVIVASLVFYFVFPKSDRKFIFRFTMFALMISFAIDGFISEPLIWRIIDWIVFAVLAVVIGRLLVGQKMSRLFLVVIFMTLFELWIPLGDLSALSRFNVDYIGHLASQDPQVPALPVATIPDLSRPGYQTILALKAYSPDKTEAQTLIDQLGATGSQQVQDALIQVQHSYDIVAIQPGRLLYHVAPATSKQMAALPVSALGAQDFPFSVSHFLNIDGATRAYFSLAVSPGDLLSMVLTPGQLPNELAGLSEQTANAETANWDQITGRSPVTSAQGFTIHNGLLTGAYDHQEVKVQTSGVTILGVYQLLPKSVESSPSVVLEGNNLIQVVSLPPAKPKIIATLRGSYSHPLTSDMVIADVVGNGTDQLLINSVPAQIVQLLPSGEWQTLWISGRDSFRFETVYPTAGGNMIVANSPSLISFSPIRYLGGYIYRDHQLIEKFRVYHGNLVNVQAAHVTSALSTNLLMSVFDHQEILLYGQSRIPWYGITMGVYVLALVIGIWRRYGRRSAM